MADLDIVIGNKTFTVACQDGQEQFLRSAARHLSEQADALLAQIGRMPADRMLLMAGLMLADKTITMEQELTNTRHTLHELQSRPAPPPERVEVPVIPPVVVETMAELAARAEAVATRIEERAAS